MKKYTLEQYQKMAKKFNKMSFLDKLKVLKDNKEILTLGSDHNFWVVKVLDEEIQDDLYETESGFHIENEWGSREMHDLIGLLGVNVTDA